MIKEVHHKPILIDENGFVVVLVVLLWHTTQRLRMLSCILFAKTTMEIRRQSPLLRPRLGSRGEQEIQGLEAITFDTSGR